MSITTHASARSLDNYFFGTYDEWFYSHLAGISDINDGFAHYTEKPCILSDLTFVRCRLNTVRGTLVGDWTKKQDIRTTMNLTVPFGPVTDVVLPCKDDIPAVLNGVSVNKKKLILKSGSHIIVISE